MKKRRLRLEILEERDVPSASIFGNPWLDGEHLTLSFAPNGTDIAGAPNVLSQTLAAAGPNSTMDILRAFQTWAVYADLNFGLVADGGQAFDSGGEIQSDPRFGDIRIGVRPLSGDVLAITSPFNYFNTDSGNVVLNSQQPFGSAYNLYTAMLQEAGHSLGLANNTDPSSVMYENYLGQRSGLSAGDIANIQALYGARLPDAYEGTSGNDTRSTATIYSSPVNADLSLNDIDYFRFSTSLLLTGTTIRLQASGQSLLTARITVFDANGNAVASTSAADPLHNDLTLKLTNLKSLSNYYVRVDSANGDVFGVGSYKLSIDNTVISAVTGTVNGVVNLLSNELGLNDTLATATSLLPKSLGISVQTDYLTRASFSASSDIDVYKIHAPTSPNGGPVVLIATAWSLGNPNLNPRIDVYDSAGKAVAAEILTNDSGTFTVQVTNPVAGQDYYLKASSSSGQTGNYSLASDFRSDAIELPMQANGTLSASASATTGKLAVQHAEVLHFVLGAQSTDANATVVMTIVDANNQVVAQLQAKAGDTQSLDVFLQAGLYSVQISAVSSNGTLTQPVQFHLGAIGITDPVAAQPANPSATPAGNPPPPPPPPSGSFGSDPGPPAYASSISWCYWWGDTPSDTSQWY